MKKNKMMRIASVLLVAVLLSTCAIFGTFAKYTTEVSSSDQARVAKWGFNTASINFENLFAESYTNVANGSTDTAIIAPGTNGKVAFIFENNSTTNAPEVKYSFKLSTDGSACHDAIQKDANIKWALVESADAATVEADLTSAEWGTWTALIAELEALDGNKDYEAGAIPDMVDTEYTILWNWSFSNTDDGNDNNNYNDTDLGNMAATEDLVVTLKITITATQLD